MQRVWRHTVRAVGWVFALVLLQPLTRSPSREELENNRAQRERLRSAAPAPTLRATLTRAIAEIIRIVTLQPARSLRETRRRDGT